MWFPDALEALREMWEAGRGAEEIADAVSEISYKRAVAAGKSTYPMATARGVWYQAGLLGLSTDEQYWAWRKSIGRKPLSRILSARVLSRDNFKCLACDRSAEETELQIDHIVPVFYGGTNDIDNLQTLCPECHRIKGMSSVDCRKPFQVVIFKYKWSGDVGFRFEQIEAMP